MLSGKSAGWSCDRCVWPRRVEIKGDSPCACRTKTAFITSEGDQTGKSWSRGLGATGAIRLIMRCVGKESLQIKLAELLFHGVTGWD